MTTVPSQSEADEFARHFSDSIRNESVPLTRLPIDVDSMADRSVEGVDLPSSMIANARLGIREGLMGPDGMFAKFRTKIVDEGGRFKPLHSRLIDGQMRVSFRFIDAADATTYIDVMLRKDAGGNVNAVDVFSLNSGEFFSETVKRALLLAAGHGDLSILKTLSDRDRFFLKHRHELFRFTKYIDEGKPSEALRYCRAFPRELQLHKFVLMQRLRVALALEDDAEYQKVTEDVRALYPSNVSAECLSIRYFIAKKEFDRSLAAIDAVDKAVGGDPYLAILRSTPLVELKRHDEAMKTLLEAITAEPDLEDLYWKMFDTTVAQERFDRTLIVLKKIDARFKIEWEVWQELASQEPFSPFVKSPQHDEWLTYLKNRQNPDEEKPPE